MPTSNTGKVAVNRDNGDEQTDVQLEEMKTEAQMFMKVKQAKMNHVLGSETCVFKFNDENCRHETEEQQGEEQKQHQNGICGAVLGKWVIATEYVKGGDIGDRVAKEKIGGCKQKITLFYDVMRGLKALHEKNIWPRSGH
jgi:hypothetical protein